MNFNSKVAIPVFLFLFSPILLEASEKAPDKKNLPISPVSNKFPSDSAKLKKYPKESDPYWAFRMSCGLNMIRTSPSREVPIKNSYSFYSSGLVGYTGQLGIKVLADHRKHSIFVGELNYSCSTYEMRYRESDLRKNYYADLNYFARSHQLQVALMDKITFGKKKIVYLSPGIFVSGTFASQFTGIKKAYDAGIPVVTLVSKSDNFKEQLNFVNIGGLLSLGATIPVGKRMLAAEVRCQPSITRTFTNPNIKNTAFLFGLEYFFVKRS